MIGGFSQGACIAYLTALTSERKLAGVAALSGWLGMAEKIKSVRLLLFAFTPYLGVRVEAVMGKQMMTDHATKLRVFHGHGTGDQVVK